jgi:hypothetical protein
MAHLPQAMQTECETALICRPYWYTAVAFALAGTPVLITKAVFLFPTDAWLAPMALIAASLGFALAHLGSAMNIMLWARRRHTVGLSGYDKLLPWEVCPRACNRRGLPPLLNFLLHARLV